IPGHPSTLDESLGCPGLAALLNIAASFAVYFALGTLGSAVHRATWIKFFISGAAIALIGAHAAWPNLKVDAITLGLFIVAVLPWLSTVVESAEFPGGWKIKFRDLEAAARKVTKAA